MPTRTLLRAVRPLAQTDCAAGVNRPAVPVTRTFRIDNPTATAWTFDQFHTTCRCTVADISAEVIPPGGSADVLFRYKPPADPADDSRAIGVAFQEPAAPHLRLTVSARVRHPLTVFPVKVRLTRLPFGKPHAERVTVENTSGDTLPAPRLSSDRDWLTVGNPEPLAATEPGVTQKWAVPLTVAADRLPPGDHTATVSAAAGQPHPEGLRLPVDVQVVPPLDPTPGQLFFGGTTVGRPTTITFAVRLPAGVTPDTLTLAHDLGPQLTTAATGGSPGRATFTVTLTPTAAGTIRGTLGVRCGDPTVPETKLPVMARAVADGE